MKILRLCIENFLTIGQATLSLDDKGLVLIRGVNLDEPSAKSNGAGKSSIADAIYWCLYNETARDESGDAVVNEKAKKNCRVSLYLQDGDIVYRIVRHRKHAIHKNATTVESMKLADFDDYLKGASIDFIEIAKGTEKETQTKINEIVGASREVFAASIYAGQEQMPDLPRMTDKQLKMLIEEASGTERLERAYVVAQSKVTVAKSMLAAKASGIERINRNIVESDLRLRAHAARYKEFEDGRASKAEGYQEQVETAGKEIEALYAQIAAMKPETVEKGIKLFNDKLSELKPLNEESERLRVVYAKLENASLSLENDLKGLIVRVASLRKSLDNAEEEMKKPCSECGKPHTADEIGEWKKHRELAIQEVLSQMETVSLKHKAASKEAADAKAAYEAHKATIPDATEALAKLRTLVEAKNKIKSLESAIESKRMSISTILLPGVEAALRGENPHKPAVIEEGKTLARLKVDLQEAKEEIRDQEHDLMIQEEVAKVFSPAGVRAHILDTVTPFLNEKTAEYLSALSDGSISAVWSTLAETTKGDLREKFNIEVKNEHGAKTFKGLSGGEKRKVRLATMMALQDLVATRASKPISLFIGDEIDDALDEAGLERLMGIFERKAREKGTVLIISHNELSDWIDSVATVTKSEGYSAITGALEV